MEEKPPKSLIELLELADYFEFTDKRKVEELKKKIEKSFEKWRSFNTLYDDGGSVCHKVFHCDSEALWEENGYSEQLKELRSGLQIVCDYKSLENFMPKSSTASSEYLAVVEFITIVNNWLQWRSSRYLLYPVYGGNDGNIYILSELQFMLLNKAIRDNRTRPYHLDQWKIVFQNNEDVVKNPDQPPILQAGMKIQHALGIGEVMSIDDKGVALVKFQEGERRIILKFAKYEILA